MTQSNQTDKPKTMGEEFEEFITEFYFTHCRPDKRPDFKTVDEAQNWYGRQEFKYNTVIKNEADRIENMYLSQLQSVFEEINDRACAAHHTMAHIVGTKRVDTDYITIEDLKNIINTLRQKYLESKEDSK